MHSLLSINTLSSGKQWAHNGITSLEEEAPEQHDAVLVLPRRGSHPPGQSPGVLLDKGCRPAPADACTTLGRTPHARDRQAEDNTSSARLFGCGTHGNSLVPLVCSERSSWHLLADVLVAALCSHRRFYPYIPIADLSQRSPFFRPADFQYDAKRDIYVCPAGKELHFCQRQTTERSRRYRARAKDCNHCPLKAQCTTSKQGRSLCRSVDEACLDRVRAHQPTEAYKKALRKRQVWVEPLFALGKQWHGMQRFRLRRLWRVNCEALMRAAGQNLKRLLKKGGWGLRPCPAEAMVVLLFGLVGVVDSCFWAYFLAQWSFSLPIGSDHSMV